MNGSTFCFVIKPSFMHDEICLVVKPILMYGSLFGYQLKLTLMYMHGSAFCLVIKPILMYGRSVCYQTYFGLW